MSSLSEPNTLLWVRAAECPWWPAKVCDVAAAGFEASDIPAAPGNTLVYFYQSYNALWVDVGDAEVAKALTEADLTEEETTKRVAEANGDAGLHTAIKEALTDLTTGRKMDLVEKGDEAAEAETAEGADPAPIGDSVVTDAVISDLENIPSQITQDSTVKEEVQEDDSSNDDLDLKKSKKSKKGKKEKKAKKEKKEKKEKKAKREREEEDATPAAPEAKRQKKTEEATATPTMSHEDRVRQDSRRAGINDSELYRLNEMLTIAINTGNLTEQRTVLERLTQIQPTLAQLKETGVGKTVIQLINTPLQPLAKVLVQMWKAILPEPPRNIVVEKFTPQVEVKQETQDPSFTQPFPSQAESNGSQEVSQPQETQDEVQHIQREGTQYTARPEGNDYRTGMQTRLVKALNTADEEGRSVVPAGDAGQLMVDHLASEMVSQLGLSITSVEAQRVKFRQILSNLQDPKNASFREMILSKPGGVYQAVATMSTADMANPEKRDEIDKTTQYERDAMRTDFSKPITTDQFRCGRCKKNRTTYFQMQTRSADEPMTTFVTCVECGNAWKFC